MNILADSFQKLQNNKYKIELDFFESSINFKDLSIYLYLYKRDGRFYRIFL